MIFSPKSSKFKKYQKGGLKNKIKNNYSLNIYTKKAIKLVSSSYGGITSKQMIAIRFLIKKFMKKKGLVRFMIFPQTARSKKPSEIRMGKGKGSIAYWSALLKSGTIICEIFFKFKFKRLIIKLLKRVQLRLPVKTKVIF